MTLASNCAAATATAPVITRSLEPKAFSGPRPSSLPGVLLAAACVVMLAACGKQETAAPASPASPAAVSAPSVEPVAGLEPAAIETMKAISVCSVENVAVHPALVTQPAVDNTYKAPLGSTVKFIGFATDKEKGQPLASFTLLLVGQQIWGISGQTGLERPDVADYFKKPALAPSGYHLDASLGKVPAGKYRVWLRSPEGLVCPTHQSLIIG